MEKRLKISDKNLKILLINPPVRTISDPSYFPFGLGYLAAVLIKGGYEVRVLDINGYRYDQEKVESLLRDFLLKEKIDIVGIGCLITCYNYVKWLNSTIRKIKPKTRIIVGGGIATSVPELVLKRLDADIAVLGEGEETIIELMRFFENKIKISTINGIYYKSLGNIKRNTIRERTKDLDKIPFPAWDLFPMEVYIKNVLKDMPEFYNEDVRGMGLVSARGCPYHCTFCYDPLGHSRTERSVKSIIEEIGLLKQKYNIRYLFFTDPCFVLNKKWVYELCDEMINKNLDIKWISTARVNLVDEPLLRKMKKAGCVSVNYGIESGSQRMLNIMKKGATVEQASKAIRITRKIGMTEWLSFMMGFPEETKKDMMDTAKFCIDNDIHLIALFIPTGYPGTALYEQIKKQGLIKDEEGYISNLGNATDLILNISSFSDKELLDLRDQVIKKVRKAYFRKHFFERIKWDISKTKWLFQNIKKNGLMGILKKLFDRKLRN